MRKANSWFRDGWISFMSNIISAPARWSSSQSTMNVVEFCYRHKVAEQRLCLLQYQQSFFLDYYYYCTDSKMHQSHHGFLIYVMRIKPLVRFCWKQATILNLSRDFLLLLVVEKMERRPTNLSDHCMFRSKKNFLQLEYSSSRQGSREVGSCCIFF